MVSPLSSPAEPRPPAAPNVAAVCDRRLKIHLVPALALSLMVALAGCHSVPQTSMVAAPVPGDEIIVTGQRIHTGTRVVTWHEPRGYNAYAGQPPLALRESSLAEKEKQRIREHGWDLGALQKVVDQFVLHYDACGVSRRCFEVLHARDLSVHFLLDVDGTIYQTLDLQERALHATTSNERSIGIEIANIGAYPPDAAQSLDLWYRRAAGGGTALTIPAQVKEPGILTPHFQGRPARAEPVRAVLQKKPLIQYDFTPEQYAALTKLTATLCRLFPRLRCDYPHAIFSDEPIAQKLSDAKLARYRGLLGHYHLQENKVDPGPAFQWKTFLAGVRRAMK